MRDYQEYFDVVYRRAFVNARNAYAGDGRTLVRTLIFSLVVGVVNALRSLNGIQMTSNILNIVIGFVACMIVWFLGLFIWNLFAEPIRIYHEMKAQADKFTWNNIGIKVHSFPKNSVFGVGLDVFSNKPSLHFIQLAGAVITYVQREKANMGMDLPQKLVWVNEDRRDRGTECRIAPNETKILGIANWNTDSAWLEVENQDNAPRLDLGISYQVEIHLHGEVDGRRMDDFKIVCDLKADWDEEKKMNVDILNLDRQ